MWATRGMLNRESLATHTHNWKATVVVTSYIEGTRHHEKHLCANKNHVQLEVEQLPNWKSLFQKIT